MVPAKGTVIPVTKSVWHPSTGTLRPDPTGSGYSIPSRAVTPTSEPDRSISPGHNEKRKEEAEAKKNNIFFHYKYSWTFLGPSLRGAFAYPGQGFGFDIFTGFPGKHLEHITDLDEHNPNYLASCLQFVAAWLNLMGLLSLCGCMHSNDCKCSYLLRGCFHLGLLWFVCRITQKLFKKIKKLDMFKGFICTSVFNLVQMQCRWTALYWASSCCFISLCLNRGGHGTGL